MMKAKERKADKLLFVLSVDTEEEFDWEGGFPQENCSVDNIRYLPEFHQFCESLNIRPTYMVDYPVASTAESAAIIKDILARGNAEVGAHLHPWCTPPIEGPNTERESHVINLPAKLIRRKLEVLLAAIEDNIGVRPTVFRTGRWGIDGKVLQILIDYGFKVDSSVYPYYSNQYFSCRDACDQPYWPNLAKPNYPGTQRKIFELPITSGFNRPDFPFWEKVHARISSPGLQTVRLVGLAWHTQMLRKLFLSPELTTAGDMIALVKAAIASGSPVIHMFLHSSTLLEKPGEYNQNNIRRRELYASVRSVIEYLSTTGSVEFCTLTEAAARMESKS
ncbi:MAG: WalW protein [Pseudomonadales bacterium]|jgi:hypothetical protein|uniref:polysaccharide deacetylase family protein n=1 Tax=unclassified Ketobacter TaxID=2639109 RepID=UPI000C8BABD0|nr:MULTISPECIES: polysaccharide deacetylase family protein [unclassified Ketobacter]MAQ24013.1 WalW protein [Pseudomonadales bacterium]MEC8813861.1 polysaccharide deacetylase family protein [Pseudomonadota bacterium]TNC90875.1 MAG: WalW protein [Alcanivorax sp.]HAG92801.1 WalW protein [Gammaproteobacteria bacterium]MCK5792492.1 polysaccharide deacetylase family protein [Ketobacter sp.]|tara:strand:- start:3107 stop:4108 length:1002 start_codon:yes stop_codon:yes gene_type:complete